MQEEKTVIEKIMTPPVIVERDAFQIKIAENEREVEEALRLRYDVFNLERGHDTGVCEWRDLDKDKFDDYCLHLVVVELQTKRIVGTYRIHPGEIATQGIGFYSEQEYDIKGLEPLADNLIEVGRSCVHPDFRTGTVVALLWSGIASILKRSGKNFLLGCASLETVDPVIGWAIYEYMMDKGHGSDILEANAVTAFDLPYPDEDKVANLLEENPLLVRKSMPPLLKGYLRIGAKICGPPAWDKEFGSIDYLILFDLSKMPDKYVKHFC